MQLAPGASAVRHPAARGQHVNAAEDPFPWWWLPKGWSAADKVVVRIPDLAEVVTAGEFRGTVTAEARLSIR